MNEKNNVVNPLSNFGIRHDQAKGYVTKISSGELLAGRPELVIEHNGREYRLRLTQSGKLILTA